MEHEMNILEDKILNTEYIEDIFYTISDYTRNNILDYTISYTNPDNKVNSTQILDDDYIKNIMKFKNTKPKKATGGWYKKPFQEVENDTFPERYKQREWLDFYLLDNQLVRDKVPSVVNVLNPSEQVLDSIKTKITSQYIDIVSNKYLVVNLEDLYKHIETTYDKAITYFECKRILYDSITIINNQWDDVIKNSGLTVNRKKFRFENIDDLLIKSLQIGICREYLTLIQYLFTKVKQQQAINEIYKFNLENNLDYNDTDYNLYNSYAQHTAQEQQDKYRTLIIKGTKDRALNSKLAVILQYLGIQTIFLSDIDTVKGVSPEDKYPKHQSFNVSEFSIYEIIFSKSTLDKLSGYNFGKGMEEDYVKTIQSEMMKSENLIAQPIDLDIFATIEEIIKPYGYRYVEIENSKVLKVGRIIIRNVYVKKNLFQFMSNKIEVIGSNSTYKNENEIQETREGVNVILDRLDTATGLTDIKRLKIPYHMLRTLKREEVHTDERLNVVMDYLKNFVETEVKSQDIKNQLLVKLDNIKEFEYLIEGYSIYDILPFTYYVIEMICKALGNIRNTPLESLEKPILAVMDITGYDVDEISSEILEARLKLFIILALWLLDDIPIDILILDDRSISEIKISKIPFENFGKYRVLDYLKPEHTVKSTASATDGKQITLTALIQEMVKEYNRNS